MANLLVEIGNTALKAAWSEGVTLGRTFRYQGENTIDFILSLTVKEKPGVLAVISQTPLSSGNEEALRNNCSSLLLLNPEKTDFLVNEGFPEYLGFDRAASLIAVKYLFKGKSCTVFDFGTVLTVDFIDSGGSYKGGNISPGCRTRFLSLNRYSRNLPLLSAPLDMPAETDSVQSSMESGVISGIMFEIEGYSRLHPENIVIFTGGDANYFAKKMKNSIFVVCNLVLMGLAIITDRYVR